MPIVSIFSHKVRVRPMLDAIGAQESLEHCNRTPGNRGSLVRRRNSALRRLRDEERAAFNAWRDSDEHARAAAYAVLTDLPEEPAVDTYVLIVRYGSETECMWERAYAPMSHGAAVELQQYHEAKGRRAIVRSKRDVDTIGLPVGWEPKGIDWERDEIAYYPTHTHWKKAGG